MSFFKSPESVSWLRFCTPYLIKWEKEYAQWVTLLGFIYILFMVATIVDDLFKRSKLCFYSKDRGLQIEIVQIVGLY